jgi:pimeloyl-ACP methyl ester carboxylesterase
MQAFELINKIDNKQNLVVFIHGYTGTHDTWQLKDGTRPFIDTLLLNQVIKSGYNVALFKYQSSQFFYNKSSRSGIRIIKDIFFKEQRYNQSIETIAELLKDEIDLYRDENSLQSVNLYIVAHSMGGLISKCFITENNKNTKFKFKQFHSVHVPHNGTSSADFRNILPSSIQIKDLKPESELVQDLRNAWLKAIQNKLPITFYHIGKNDNVVMNTSAEGTENRKLDKDFFLCRSEFNHSDFLENINNDNKILRRISIELEKSLNEEDLEKIHNSKKGQLDVVNNEIITEHSALEMFYPQCKETACLVSNQSELVERISNFVQAIHNIPEDNVSFLKNELVYFLTSARFYLLDPNQDVQLLFKGLKKFEGAVYNTMIDKISDIALCNCSCEANQNYKTLKEELNKKIFKLSLIPH